MANRSGQTFEMPKTSQTLAAEVITTLTGSNTVNSEKITKIPLSEIDPFPNHPFLVKNDEAMQNMSESINTFGIQTPAIVRQKEDGRYELISGHRRKMASELIGLNELPCIVRQLSDPDAVIAMVDGNLQRENILPSEKAKSYKMRLNAMKKQAGRPPKENVSPMGTNLRSDEELANISGDSRNQIHRFIRLNELTPQMLGMVDKGTLPMRPAVELSYLSQEEQQILLDVIASEDRAPSHAEATQMRKLSDDGRLDEAAITSIMREEKPHKQAHFKLSTEKLRRFFPAGTPIKTIELTIIKALELWQSKNQ